MYKALSESCSHSNLKCTHSERRAGSCPGWYSGGSECGPHIRVKNNPRCAVGRVQEVNRGHRVINHRRRLPVTGEDLMQFHPAPFVLSPSHTLLFM